MIELTEEEKKLGEARNKALEEMAQALVKAVTASGGIDLMRICITLQTITTQLTVLIDMLFEAEPASRAEYYKRTTAEFLRVTSEVTKTLIIAPEPIRRQ